MNKTNSNVYSDANVYSEHHLSGLWAYTAGEYIGTFRIIYFIVLSISMTSAALVVIITIKRKQHCTLASKNLFSLILNILINQILMTIELTNWTPGYVVCYTSAVASQFGLLGTFSWLNVLTFDIWRATCEMRSHEAAKRVHQRYRFLYYSLYGWLCPAAMVFVSILIDHSEQLSSDFKPNFVENDHRKCFLSSWQNTMSTVIYLCIPEAILTCLNCGFLFLAFCSMWKTRKLVGTVLHRKTKNRFLFYFHLFLFKDLTMLLGEIPIWTTNYILISLIVLALNKLIGFYLLILFVWHSN